MIPVINVTTPCINVADTIDRTIISVLSQAGDFFIRYHIQDGGSSDGTVERLAWWQDQLKVKNYPLQCLGMEFTYTSESDSGMYDALVKGLDATRANPDSFMTWINGDDMFMPGAFEFVANVSRQFSMSQLSWINGAVSVYLGNLPNVTYDRPHLREVLRLGLCDGVHWDFVQQEGSFFRKKLWDSINPKQTIRPLRFAGDWNLWRLFAAKASLVQVRFPLGSSRIRSQQLSARLRDDYLGEIESLVPTAVRRQALEELARVDSVYRRVFQINYGQKTLSVADELQNTLLAAQCQKVFGKSIQLASDAPSLKKVYQGENADIQTLTDRRDVIAWHGNILSYDIHWQYPAITEQHAFHRIRDTCFINEGITYVAYPWANLIDKLQTSAPDRYDHLVWFLDFCRQIPKGTLKVTVCQHILMKNYLYLFDMAGVSKIFWSHATHTDILSANFQTRTIFSFPLFPVQIPKAIPDVRFEVGRSQRKYLFSFIGARANSYYLTDARNWILDLLKNRPRSLVVGRESWHYQKIVYEHQVKCTHNSIKPRELLESATDSEFVESLKQSIFSLCPSGSGPNSIRLWESIAAGAIPVILADSWTPPGNKLLWEMAAIFCKEDPEEIKQLPDRLAKISENPEKLLSMRHAMRQLWLLYGPDSFVTDIQVFMLSHTEIPIQSSDVKVMKVNKSIDFSVINRDLNAKDGKLLLRNLASALLLNPGATLQRIESDYQLSEGLHKARAAETFESDLVNHYDAVAALARRKVNPINKSLVATAGSSVPRVCLYGRHSNRTPLSYEPIRRMIGSQISFVDSPFEADLVVTGFNKDISDNFDLLSSALGKSTKTKMVVLSEEPLWDITWSGDLTGREARVSGHGLEIPYTFLGHETSDIFEFDRIPYFVLTSDHFAVRYANLISRFSGLKPEEMLQRWRKAEVSAAFFMEKRASEAFSCDFPDRDVFGLSAYRTEVAENITKTGVLRVGKGWGTDSRRQDLPDWHLDKLARIDGRTRVLSAFENVHQRLYITEKIFDAFAVGAIPAYWASPRHRVFELVPEASMLNCFGITPKEAANKIDSFEPDLEFADAWLDTAAKLASLFRNFSIVQTERQRIADATLQEILVLA